MLPCDYLGKKTLFEDAVIAFDIKLVFCGRNAGSFGKDALRECIFPKPV